MRIRQHRRRGISAVEFAIISPVLLLFMLGLVVGAFGIFRYQLVASLAREGARYASVRGARYEVVTGDPAATKEDVLNNAILPNSVALDKSKLNCDVTWEPDNKQDAYVVVKVKYQWVPEVYLGGITLSSTSKIKISY
jgi:Flp pilus assembly protein TadG